MESEQFRRVSLRLITTAPLLGAIGGVVSGIVLAIVGGVAGAGLVIFVAALVVGIGGTTVAVSLTLLGRFVTRRASPVWLWDPLWSIVGSAVAWAVVYLVLFRSQTQWNPAVFVLLLSFVTGLALFVILRIPLRVTDASKGRA